MKLFIYNFIHNRFSQNARNKLKEILFKVKKRGQIYYKIRYSNFSAQDLCDELKRKIGSDFDVLMVHCAYDNLLPMYNQGLMELLNVLLRIADRKTLAMPAFFLGQPVFAFNAGEFYKSNPLFDSRKTVSQTGLLSEVFRRHPESKRSLHPTHSICALGPLADRLVSSHHLAETNFGEGTPFEIMTSFKTVILGIGAPFYRCLTQIHCPEDLLSEDFPFSVYAEKIPVVLQDETHETYEYLLSVHRKGLRRDIGLLRKLLSKDELKEWTFHGVPMFCTTAKRVTEALCEAALRGQTIYNC